MECGFCPRHGPSSPGRIFDSNGKQVLRGVVVAAHQNGRELDRIGIDDSGSYHLSLMPAPGQPCDLSFTAGQEGCWLLAQNLTPGQRLKRDVQLNRAVSIEGTVTMLDTEKSPHREVTVQALMEGKAVAVEQTDAKGHYQFVNLRPGDYVVRCQTPLGAFVCRAQGSTAPALSPSNAQVASIRVQSGRTAQNVDARFAAFKKGIWRQYDTLDGLPNNQVLSLARAPSGEIWIQTSGGLGSLNGERFSTLPGTEGWPITRFLAVAPDGSVWFGTYNGLYRREAKGFSRFWGHQWPAG